MSGVEVRTTRKQRERLLVLWWIYGNNGKKHHMSDHKFIQGILEHDKDYRKFYQPSEECIAEVDRVLKEA